MTKTKVLILYAEYGEGHHQVSRTLQTQFKDHGISDVILKDLFAEAHPIIDRMTRFVYEQSFSGPSLFYGWSYYLTQNMGHETPFSRRFHSFGIRKLREIIKTEQPDLVINTFPMLAMPELKQRTGINIPIFTILTDFDLHGRWLHSKIDKYYVATEDLKNRMTDRGVPEENIKISGIPISQSFESSSDLAAVRHTYKLSPSKQTVLVMTGTYSAFKDLRNFCLSLSKSKSLQIILVCGKDKKLKAEMASFFAEQPNIRVLGFSENIHRLMKVSTCIATKSGGVTLSEAIRAGLPIFLFPPVPGQEKENARYLIEKGAARTAKNGQELSKEIRETLANPLSFIVMKQAVKALQRPNAAQTVVSGILKEIEKWESPRKEQAQFS